MSRSFPGGLHWHKVPRKPSQRTHRAALPRDVHLPRVRRLGSTFFISASLCLAGGGVGVGGARDPAVISLDVFLYTIPPKGLPPLVLCLYSFSHFSLSSSFPVSAFLSTPPSLFPLPSSLAFSVFPFPSPSPCPRSPRPPALFPVFPCVSGVFP